jgi:tryptophan-rich sensory protein
MGISLYLVWQPKSKLKKAALSIFYAQLIINSVWSILFFGAKSPVLAFIAILMLWVLIAATIVNFIKLTKLRAIYLLPTYYGSALQLS